MATVAADAKPADAPAHQQNPERMGEFMSEDVEDNRPGQAEERDQPKDRAQRKEPKFFACPKPLRHGCVRKDSEKCLRKNRADRQQKNCENKLHPACGYRKWIRRRNESCRSRDISDDLSATVRSTLFICRSSIRRSQSHLQITQIHTDYSKTEPRITRTFRATSMTLFMTSFCTRNKIVSAGPPQPTGQRPVLPPE